MSAPRDTFELLAVGGGPAGLSAVRGYRDAGGSGPAAIVTDEERMPYRRPPLTKELMRGELDEDELPLEDESWPAEHGVALVGGRAVALDVRHRTLTLSGGRRLSYDRCVLATGAEPTRLPIPGGDDPAVRVVRTLDHVRELLHRLPDGAAAAVIGSGFIGCEIAASLRHRGHSVALFSDEDVPQAARLGEDAGAEIARWLQEEGVALHLGAEADAIERADGRLRVTAGDAEQDAAVVVMATGVAPRAELAAAAGITLDGGRIRVDASMRSSADGVLAAGDVCLADNVTAGRAVRVEHWGDALGQGEVAGRCAAGAAASWEAVPGFWSTIGARTLKYAAWGDGFDDVRFERGRDGSFTAWYAREGRIVGVLAHGDDDAYDRGREMIAAGEPWSR